MSSDSSRKKKVRRQQRATGDSYTRTRRQMDNGGDAPAAGEIPPPASQAELLSLLGLDRAGVPDVTALWPQRQLPVGTGEAVDFGPLLRTPIGLGAGGSPVWLDLKPASLGGDGPNGLLVGSTGSGKSALAKAMLFGLCAQHSPDLLQIVSFCAKFESTLDFADYPHTVSIPRSVDYKAALIALMDHRAQALRAADGVALGEDQVIDLNDGTIESYHRARAVVAGAELPAVPYTVVVFDEISLLVAEDPGLLPVVDVLMRRGRSLGICVLITSQTLDPSWVGRLTGNASYRMAMRVNSAEASHQLIGNLDAYHLPGRDKGLGFYRSAPGADPVAFRGFEVFPPDLVRTVGLHLADRRNQPVHLELEADEDASTSVAITGELGAGKTRFRHS